MQFFQAAVVSIRVYGCTTWKLTKRMEKKLDGNYTRMLLAILNKSWKQHHTKHQLYGHLPPITKTIKIWGTKHEWLCWSSRGRAHKWCTPMDPFTWPSKSRATGANLCFDTECSPEDLPEAMNDREECQGYPCWWCGKMMRWYIYIYIYMTCKGIVCT